MFSIFHKVHKCVHVIYTSSFGSELENMHRMSPKKKNVTTNRHIEETGKCLDVSIDYDSDCSIVPTPFNLW